MAELRLADSVQGTLYDGHHSMQVETGHDSWHLECTQPGKQERVRVNYDIQTTGGYVIKEQVSDGFESQKCWLLFKHVAGCSLFQPCFGTL